MQYSQYVPPCPQKTTWQKLRQKYWPSLQKVVHFYNIENIMWEVLQREFPQKIAKGTSHRNFCIRENTSIIQTAVVNVAVNIFVAKKLHLYKLVGISEWINIPRTWTALGISGGVNVGLRDGSSSPTKHTFYKIQHQSIYAIQICDE